MGSPLLALLSVHTLQNLLDTWGYLVVFAFVAIESSGIPFPGETMLVVASIYAGQGHLQITWVIVAAAAGAILGDNAGYWAGRTGGRRLALRYGRYIRFDQETLKTAEDFFRRHGDKTVFLGRFVAVLRAWAAFLAGMNHMPWPKFLLFNAAGGITWSVLYGVLAYKLGQTFEKLRGPIGIGAVVVALLVVLALFVLYRRRAMRSQAKDTQSDDAGHDDSAALPPAAHDE
jgi:membrane protein DedA with SNARE-associated domain